MARILVAAICCSSTLISNASSVAQSQSEERASAARSVTGGGIGLYMEVPRSKQQANELIAKCRANGISMVMPSLSGGGTVLWKTDKADYYPAQRKLFESGFDGLAVLIQQAHAAHIKVYPSVAVCPAGREMSGHPEWETRDREGKPSSATTAKALAMSYPKARQAKIAVLMDLVEGYDIDGILLDYCRYPENGSKPEYRYGYYGYDAPLIAACRDIYGFHPAKVKIDSPRWKKFNAMRAETVTSFVREFRQAVQQSRRKIRIGGFGDVSPEMEARSCGRDYAAWAQRGLIDDFFLATYTQPVDEMQKTVSHVRQAIGPKVVLLSALCPFQGFLKTNKEMTTAAKAQLAGSADGLWIYREDFLSKLNLWQGARDASRVIAKQN